MLSCSPTRHRLSSSYTLLGSGLSHKFKARTQTPSTKRCRNGTFAALNFFRRKIATSGAVDDILAVVSDTDRGCSTSRSQRASIDAAIGTLEGAGNDASLFNNGLSATWKLLWITEKVRWSASFGSQPAVAVSRRLAFLQETLFIIRYANLFRTTAGEVYQVAWASSTAELAFACLCMSFVL